MNPSVHRLTSRLRLITAAGVLSLLSVTRAQQPAETPAVPPAPAAQASAAVPPAPAPLDPKLLKQLEAILNQKFTRDPADIFRGLERAGTADSLNPTERFFADFRTGDWAKIREALAGMPPDLARRIYDKMLADLTEKQKPNVRLDEGSCAASCGARRATPT